MPESVSAATLDQKDGHVAAKRKRSVFLSCVSSQLGGSRRSLKTLLADRNIDLRIQEDFVDSASPRGTLVKLYRYLAEPDLVVQVIGSHPSAKVSSAECEELLRVDPSLEQWLRQTALLAALEQGELGYTDFEAYLALYLRKPLLPVRLHTGSQRDHEMRLQRLGRHVEARLDRIDDLPALIEEALGHLEAVDHAGLAARAEERRKWGIARLAAWLLFVVSFVFVLQWSATVDVGLTDASLPLITGNLAALGLCVLGYVSFHYIGMLDELTASFRWRVSVSNGLAALLVAASIGWGLAGLDTLFHAVTETWPKLVLASVMFALLPILAFARLSPDTHPPKRCVRLAFVGTLLWIPFLCAVRYWSLDFVYWVVIAAAVFKLGFSVRATTDALEEDIAASSKEVLPNGAVRSNRFYGVHRNEVFAALQPDDFTSKPRRTPKH